MLSSKTEDEAVLFVRQFSESDKKFKPVLKISDSRFFMQLEQKGLPNSKVPSFYVSLDKVSYKGLVGRKGKASRLELEAEIIDDLTQDSQEDTQAKLVLMDNLSIFLKNQFGLTESPESKFESGIKLTVLP